MIELIIFAFYTLLNVLIYSGSYFLFVYFGIDAYLVNYSLLLYMVLDQIFFGLILLKDFRRKKK